MNNIWFLRMDKDGRKEDFDMSESHQFIYSDHGSCGNQSDPKIQNYKKNIFPKMSVSEKELRNFINETKIRLIDSGYINQDDLGKKQCDLFISYWICTMEIGDIVFVRTKKQEVFICQISGYVSEEFFDKYGSFQRPVKLLKKINTDTNELDAVLHRTLGRRALERNDKYDVKRIVSNFLKTNNLI